MEELLTRLDCNSADTNETNSLDNVTYKEEIGLEGNKVLVPTFNVESKTPFLILNSKNNIVEKRLGWASILGSATSTQSFVWKFKINYLHSCQIGLLPPSKLDDMRAYCYINRSGVVGFRQGCREIGTFHHLHTNCPGWKPNDVVGLELDNGILRFYHNNVIVKEIQFTQVDYMPAVTVFDASITLITE